MCFEVLEMAAAVLLEAWGQTAQGSTAARKYRKKSKVPKRPEIMQGAKKRGLRPLICPEHTLSASRRLPPSGRRTRPSRKGVFSSQTLTLVKSLVRELSLSPKRYAGGARICPKSGNSCGRRRRCFVAFFEYFYVKEHQILHPGLVPRPN